MLVLAGFGAVASPAGVTRPFALLSAPTVETPERIQDEKTVSFRLEPVAASLGCLDELGIVADIIVDGASYQRQRAVFEKTGDLRSVVDSVVSELG